MNRRRSPLRLWGGLLALAVGVLVLIAALAHGSSAPGGNRPADAASTNPYLDPGTPLSAPAPDFTLTDQFGRSMSLSSYRGKVVILAFNDSQCTTICPLTTQAMVEAKQLLGAAGARVALLGVDANPDATSVADVRAYSQAHGMLHAWRFGTASSARLKAVWASYHIQSAIEGGQVDHTPALFVIDPQGRERRLYMTQQAYSAVDQLGQLLAQEVAGLLPGHPRVRASLSYAQIPPIGPGQTLTLPGASGGPVRLGPGSAPRLYLFFATWTQQVLDLRGQLAAVSRYNTAARAAGLPAAIGIDEASVEPRPNPVRSFLRGLPLSFPVALDTSGRVADGYQVQDQPWLVLVSGAGRFLWYYDVATAGPISSRELALKVRAALAHAHTVVAAPAAQAAALAGSPPPLAAVHAQADQLLGSVSALKARLRTLRGYPVVVNVWGSWCGPCQAEFPLFQSASLSYGKRVAFLGLDVDDESAAAQAFLTKHPVSYPSYQSLARDVDPIIPQGLLGTPTTAYFSPSGRLVYVHTGQYFSQGSLNGDIAQYALG
jgi:cytochrome oxidase Cu insertion factor (SCO1/SenC/PrrC family)/thiol-disulfide isomerase/thioredoxin